MSKPKFAWSFSYVNSFETCPRQFYHSRILKDVPFERNAAAIYGEEGHSAIEKYGRDNKPLPSKFSFAQPMVDVAKNMPGDKYWEKKLAVKQDFTQCEYYDKETWFRAQIDYLQMDKAKKSARVLDWKFGNSAWADTGQLEITSLVLFEMHPTLEIVRAGLSFPKDNKFAPAVYKRSEKDERWDKWHGKLERIEAAFDSGVWNEKPSGLCRKHCPVFSCPHNGRSQ